ncbi:MAG: phage integrase N-terminal SAM-like domain-containing protein, partial [Ferruginibacter sp.]
MQKVKLCPLLHRGQESIGIYFDRSPVLQQRLRAMKGMRWSVTNTCWYIIYADDIYASLINIFEKYAVVDRAEMEEFLVKRTQLNNIQQITGGNISVNHSRSVLYNISSANLAELARMLEILQLKAYSNSTIKTYKNEFSVFLRVLKDRNVVNMTADVVKRYILYCINVLNLSENTIHSRLNALKFYFEQVLHNEKIFFEIPRPKRPLLLPRLLNENELGRLFNALTNKKHKAMLFTAYSGGLRVSEIVSLKIRDIDSKRMQIFISRAKGK